MARLLPLPCPRIWGENGNSAQAERGQCSDEQDPFAGGAEDIG